MVHLLVKRILKIIKLHGTTIKKCKPLFKVLYMAGQRKTMKSFYADILMRYHLHETNKLVLFQPVE
jgi:hypothetical protein